MSADPLRIYEPSECGPDGYPHAWHSIDGGPGVKHLVRAAAGQRCVRCQHPYQKGEGEWSRCDDRCRHGYANTAADEWGRLARWRILTVHHLTGCKADCRWWNLTSLCQRCHLVIQGRVFMDRVYVFEHSEWFKPYAAGWYAWSYLGLELSRDEVAARLDELLALERLDGPSLATSGVTP